MKPNVKTPEFEPGQSEWPEGLSRRDFLKLSTAALALAGLNACLRPPREKVYPYVSQPEDLIPGKPTYFATAHVLSGIANGVLLESHFGRPTKVEGNPDHPLSLGKSNVHQQASVLELYDPDRARAITFHGTLSSWPIFEQALRDLQPTLRRNRGAGLVFLTEPCTSPTLIAEIDRLRRVLPALKWIHYDAAEPGFGLEASKRVFGKALSPVYDFSKAQNVIAIDSDFLADSRTPPKGMKDYADHHPTLWVLESSATLTGFQAQHRLGVSPSERSEILASLLSKTSSPSSDWAKALRSALASAPGRSLFIVGATAPQELHELCHHLNARYGRECVQYHSLFPEVPCGPDALEQLVQDLNAGKVDALVIAGGNPVYTSSPDLNLAEAIRKAPFSCRLGLYADETAQACAWMIPMAHDYESWGDARAHDGTVSLIQPLIDPLYQGKQFIELLPLFAGDFVPVPPRRKLLDYWSTHWGKEAESRWKDSLRKGFIAGTALPAVQVSARASVPTSATPSASKPPFTLVLKPDSRIDDGRFANHPWLQELPDPLTKITWGNVALVNPEDAREKKIASGDVMKLSNGKQAIEIPAWTQPGQPRGVITVTLGYGRTHAGDTGNGIGVNAYPLWNGRADAIPIQLDVTSRKEGIACTQTDDHTEGRHPILQANQVKQSPVRASLYPEPPLDDAWPEAWAMVVDLDRCTGCSTCVIACQSENNIPSVGRKAILMGREMHWIRVARYFDEKTTSAAFQPLPCMHCEKAPCEVVCPVGATVHGTGGLNQMVYNRCVGTRYCSNNCPYKVRRFNFLEYNKTTFLDQMPRNPNVTVRARGVMEKCTYCIQRINEAKFTAKKEDRAIRDGEILTACQQACPTDAIVFGNQNDPESRVAKQKQLPRNYGLLEELNTVPRTTYLALEHRPFANGGGA